MGANYVRATQGLRDIQLVAVVDEMMDRATQAGAAIGARVTTQLVHAGDFEAAIVAVPSAAHSAVAVPLLRRGVHCLVEKPLALTREDCDALMAAAKDGGAVLQVGHVERFNAAVMALLAENPNPADIKQIVARRMNAGSARVTDIDVVLDLMVHDIDVVMALKRSPVHEVTATGDKDHAVARLAFEDGTFADVTASRTTPGRVRDLSVVMDDGAVYALDYIERTLTHRGADISVAGDANPLGRQVRDFARCIRRHETPQVCADQALRVLEIVWRTQQALGLI